MKTFDQDPFDALADRLNRRLPATRAAIAHTHANIYPILLVGLAAAAAGTGMQMAAQAQDRDAMNSALSAENTRQKGFQKTANDVFQQSLSKSGPDVARQQMDAGTTARQAAYAQVAPLQPLPTGTSGGNPVVVDATPDTAGQVRSTATATNNAWSKLMGDKQSKAGGYADWESDQAVKNADANSRLAVVGSQAAGSARILPIEMMQAQHSGDALAGWGQLVSALGAVAGTYGAGVGTAAGQAASAPSWAAAGSTAPLYTAGGELVSAGAGAADSTIPNAWGALGGYAGSLLH